MTFTTEEAAHRLGIEPATVRRWVMKGWLTPVQLGVRPLRFHRQDVERALSERVLQANEHARIDDTWSRLLDAQ